MMGRPHVVSPLVIFCTLVGVAQYIVGFGSFLEFLLGFLVAGILVGVILQRQFTVSFFKLIGGGVFLYTEYFVIISFFHKSGSFNVIVLRLL